MYHAIVARRLRHILARLNAGDHAFVLAQFAARAEHRFSGDHALAGTRHTPEGRRAWSERLALVLPGLRFEVMKVIVSGPPWRTRAAVEWRDRVFDPQGVELLANQGVFVLTLRWGKAVEFHVYCDTQALARNLGTIADRGRPEALLPPIVD